MARRRISILLMVAGLITAMTGLAGTLVTKPPQFGADSAPSPAAPDSSTEEVVRDFYQQFEVAFQSGDLAFLLEHLHPEVLRLYGEEPCLQFLTGSLGDRTFEVVRVHPPAVWNYGERLGTQILIPNAIQVDVIQRLNGEGSETATHLTVEGDSVRWFTYCENPEADPA